MINNELQAGLMTEWRALSSPELVDLVRRLRALEWSWRLADVEQVATDFGWEIERSKRNWVVLDIGFGSGSGEFSGNNGTATEIDLQITDRATSDAAGRDRTREAFAEMAAALRAEFGAPTKGIPGMTPQVRWAGPATTTVLIAFETAVHVILKTNEKLAIEDRVEELDEQGLL